MNAKLLEHFVRYREECGLEIVRILLIQKIKYQFSVMGKREESTTFLKEIFEECDIQKIMLVEARAARVYWNFYKEKIGSKVVWKGRVPHQKDVVNELLDIGYHYLSNHIRKICEEIDFPTEIGFFHKAQSKNAHPFVYDFMEWLRPIVVDEVLLVVITKKKKMVEHVDKKLIKFFVSRMKIKLDSYVYHRELKYCITFNYWIRLILLSLMHSINTYRKYKPLFPSLRHESRCKKTA